MGCAVSTEARLEQLNLINPHDKKMNPHGTTSATIVSGSGGGGGGGGGGGIPKKKGAGPMAAKYKRDYDQLEEVYRKSNSDEYIKNIPEMGDPTAPEPKALCHLYRVLGQKRINLAATRIYENIFGDYDPEWLFFSDNFRKRPIEAATLHLQWFAIQRCGGPSIHGGFEFDAEYIANFHRSFVMNNKTKQRWLYHAQNALDDKSLDLGRYPDQTRTILMQWFADFIDKSIEKNAEDD